ncbi:MAG: response regulator [Methanomicrobia archaeon]|nr:response regulator [Methanomicrobia archaeon]RLF92565.1 MAG: response regulator [Thermococci archaeon]
MREVRMRILIVDDESELIKLYRDILTKFGYSVDFALNGEEAVKSYEKAYNKGERFDCVIMDYRMPTKDGLEAMREILKLDKIGKIIFASADDSIEKEALKLGAKAFLKKPFGIDTLIGALRA